MQIGKINTFRVLRKTDLGYMLEKDEETVFLHNNELANQTIEPEQFVKAFLYFDSKNRVAATLEKPFFTLNEKGWVDVVEVVSNLGVFVNIGILKDLLVSKDDLPINPNYWPKKGDKLYIEMILKTRLVGKPVYIQDLKEDLNYELSSGDEVFGYVVHMNKNGLQVLTEGMQLIFVHHTQMRKNYRLGEKVSVNIIRAYEHTLNGSLIFQKEKMIDIDSEMILNYLKKNKSMPLTNHSKPEEISLYFKMSKKAFKRAVGALYKDKVIEFDENSIIYIGDKNE